MRIELTEHAKEQMDARQIGLREVKKALVHGSREETDNDFSDQCKQYLITRRSGGARIQVVAAIVNGCWVVISSWRTHSSEDAIWCEQSYKLR